MLDTFFIFDKAALNMKYNLVSPVEICNDLEKNKESKKTILIVFLCLPVSLYLARAVYESVIMKYLRLKLFYL